MEAVENSEQAGCLISKGGTPVFRGRVACELSVRFQHAGTRLATSCLCFLHLMGPHFTRPQANFFYIPLMFTEFSLSHLYYLTTSAARLEFTLLLDAEPA